METALNVVQTFIIVITWVSEIILCAFIIIYIIEWKKKRQFSVSDKILLSTALTNLLLQCCMAINSLVYIFWIHPVMAKQAFTLVFTLNISFIYDSIWHTAWLSIHYCLKLVVPSHSVFIQMNNRLSASIVPLLIGTSVGIFLITLPYIWTVRIEFPTNTTNIESGQNVIIDMKIPFTICNIILGCCLPFLVTLICIGLSVDALVRHVWRMRCSVSQFSSSPLLQGHLRAATTMVLQLVLNLLLYLSVLGLFISSSNIYGISENLLWSSILLNPCAQTLTLILGNPKLKTKLFCQQLSV